MCEFPSAILVKMMRETAKNADPKDPARMLYAAAFVKAVDNLRLAHEDAHSCECWYKAVNAERQ